MLPPDPLLNAMLTLRSVVSHLHSNGQDCRALATRHHDDDDEEEEYSSSISNNSTNNSKSNIHDEDDDDDETDDCKETLVYDARICNIGHVEWDDVAVAFTFAAGDQEEERKESSQLVPIGNCTRVEMRRTINACHNGTYVTRVVVEVVAANRQLTTKEKKKKKQQKKNVECQDVATVTVSVVAIGHPTTIISDRTTGHPSPGPRGAGQYPTNVPAMTTTTKPTTTSCPNLDYELCNGASFVGNCKECLRGSNCVFQSLNASYCIPMNSTDLPVPADCQQPDYAECGGRGYYGCQNCLSGSQCSATTTPYRFVCQKSSEILQPRRPELTVESFGRAAGYMTGLNETFDQLMSKYNAVVTGVNDTVISEMQVREGLMEVYASPAARERLNDLADTDASFRDFSSNFANDLQEEYCAMVSTPLSQASISLRECLCDEPDILFLHCVALMEQESERFVAQSTRRDRALTSINPDVNDNSPFLVSRDLQGSRCALGSNLQNVLIDYSALLRGESSLPGEEANICAGGGCVIPIPGIPVLALDFGVSFCGASPPKLALSTANDSDLEFRRMAADATKVEANIGLCANVPGLTDVLKFFGLPLCFLRFLGIVRPFLGILTGDVVLQVGLVGPVVEGSIMYLFDDALRNSEKLCPPDIECSSENNMDCGFCPDNVRGSVEVGIHLFFKPLTFKVYESDGVDACAEYYQSRSLCSSGIGETPRECIAEQQKCDDSCDFCCETRSDDSPANYCGCLGDGATCNEDVAVCRNICCGKFVQETNDKLICSSTPCLPGGAPCDLMSTCANCCKSSDVNDPVPFTGFCPGEQCAGRGESCGGDSTTECTDCCVQPISGFDVCGDCLPNGAFCSEQTESACQEQCCSNQVLNTGGVFTCIAECLPSGAACEMVGTSCINCCTSFEESPTAMIGICP